LTHGDDLLSLGAVWHHRWWGTSSWYSERRWPAADYYITQVIGS